MHKCIYREEQAEPSTKNWRECERQRETTVIISEFKKKHVSFAGITIATHSRVQDDYEQ